MKIKNNKRKLLAFLLSTTMLSTLSCGLLMMNGLKNDIGNQVVSAATEGEDSTTTVEKPADAVFEVDNKANVRLQPDGKGIKFRATMNSQYYAWLKAAYPNATYTFKVTVDRYNNADEGEALSETYVLKDDDFLDMDSAAEDFNYSYTVSYDQLGNLTEAQKNQAYAMVLKAQASVIVTPAEGDAIEIPADGYSVRNMMAVAKYLVDNKLYASETDKTTLQMYYSTEAATAINANATIDFLHKGTNSSGEEVDVLTFDSAIDEDYTLYINAIPLTKVSSTQFEISEELRSQLEYDTDYTVYAFDENNKCTTFTVHTYAGIIYDADDFKNVFEFSEAQVKKYATAKTGTNTTTYYGDVDRDFTGNYVLANDITISNMDHTGMKLCYKDASNATFHSITQSAINSNDATLANLFFNNGTLDGQGHKLSVTLSATYSTYGLFGYLGDNVTVKNVFIDVHKTTNNYLIIKGGLGSNAPVFDNCYFEFSGQPVNKRNIGFTDGLVKVTNSVIDYSGLAYDEANGSYDALFATATSTFENTVFIGEKRPVTGADSKVLYASNEDVTADKATGAYRFADYAAFAAKAATTEGLSRDGFDAAIWDKTTIDVPVYRQDDIAFEFALENYKDSTLRLEVGDTLDISAMYFGAPVAVTITSNNDNVEIADGVLTANTADSGTLSVSYTLDGVEVSYAIPYEVTAKAEEVATEVYYSAVDGLIYGLNLEGDFTSAYQDANTVTLTSSAKEGSYTISGLEVADTTVKGKTELVVNTSEKSYKFTNVVTVAKVIASVEDWTYLNISSTDTETKDGYVLVINDLDTTSMINLHTMKNNGYITRNNDSVANNGGWYSTLGLRGTFDGNGHTIKVKSAKGGIFGVINTLTIKDVCFIVDATAQYNTAETTTTADYSSKTCLNYILASGMRNSLLENVVIKLNSVDLTYNDTTITKAYLMLTTTCGTADMTNFVLDYGNYKMTDNDIWGGLLTLNLRTQSTCSNVYIVHNGGYRLSCYSDPLYSESQGMGTTVPANTYYAKNELDENVVSGTKGKTTKAIYRYDNITSLTSDTHYTSNTTMKWSYNSTDAKWVFSNASN